MILFPLYFREFQEIGRFYIQCNENNSLPRDISASFRCFDKDSETQSLSQDL